MRTTSQMNKCLARVCVFILMMIMTGINFTPDCAASPENAMQNYLQRAEPDYSWTLKDTNELKGMKIYDLHLVSQKWQGIVWTHQLRIFIPKDCKAGSALLFISGGSNKNGKPNWDKWNGEKPGLIAQMAFKTNRPVIALKQVPNQPLYGEKVEDDLISHTFLKYFETKDETWPLLLPMTKSAVQAMTAMQEFCSKEINLPIKGFVVAGGSKRGWTTWMTGSNDKRVIGIGPMVIDTLKMNKQMDYQLECWGKYSEQVDDYTKKGIQEKMKTPEGKDLLKIADPYSYIKQLKIPKLIFIGTNDPYWPVDAIKHYYNDLVGESYIHYVPNVGHDLGDGEQAVRSLAAFFDICASGAQHPKLKWSMTQENGAAVLKVDAGGDAKEAKLWTAASNDRDFRDDKWNNEPCKDRDGSQFTSSIILPDEGYKALYLEVIYPSPVEKTYSKTSRIFVLDPKGVVSE